MSELILAFILGAVAGVAALVIVGNRVAKKRTQALADAIRNSTDDDEVQSLNRDIKYGENIVALRRNEGTNHVDKYEA